MKVKILTGLCGCVISSMSFADCPKSMNTETMMECIMIEGSGANYQEWLEKFNENLSVSEPAPEISPITGTDIRSIKPAAGTHTD